MFRLYRCYNVYDSQATFDMLERACGKTGIGHIVTRRVGQYYDRNKQPLAQLHNFLEWLLPEYGMPIAIVVQNYGMVAVYKL